ncbi:uncharacterized protein TNCV_4850891 [Trichonephila clavipes]|nr:uncharacterized protein TNCV_4850891 [Trichonephila clavipes]
MNSYIHDFKTALQSFPPNKIVINADRRPSAEHRGRHNEQTTNELSVLLVNQDCDKRDAVLCRHDNRLQRIAETHRSYDSLQYPLMFVYGEDGYITLRSIKLNPTQTNRISKKKKFSHYSTIVTY